MRFDAGLGVSVRTSPQTGQASIQAKELRQFPGAELLKLETIESAAERVQSSASQGGTELAPGGPSSAPCSFLVAHSFA
jgi:hypothetical protein